MTDPEIGYDQRLRRDVPTGIAVLLCLFALTMPAVGLTTLLVPGPQIEARGHPLYWLILGLPAVFAAPLMEYKPAALRMVRPALFGAPLIAGAVLAFAARVHTGTMTEYWVMLALTAALTLAGGLTYDRSMLAREGPGG